MPGGFRWVPSGIDLFIRKFAAIKNARLIDRSKKGVMVPQIVPGNKRLALKTWR
jgi:hypothetical protein